MTLAHPFSAAALESLEQAIVAAAHAGARVIRDGASRLRTIEWQTKGRADYLSEIDTRAEGEIGASLRTSLLRAELTAHHSDAVMLGEESWATPTVAPRGLAFVIDPLDGTTNFLHGVPHYAVSVAAVYDGAPIAGAVYDVAPRRDVHCRGGRRRVARWRAHESI